MGVLSNKISRDELRAGDHIYSWRIAYIYAHHGIYAGEDKVIHFTRGPGQETGTGTVMDRFLFSSSPPHFADTPCPKCGDQSSLDGVISSCVECFLSGGDLYLFQYGVSPALFLAQARGGTCTLAKSDGVEEVLHRASFLLVHGFGKYDLFKNNCKDFAIYCKTSFLVRTSISGQAVSFLEAAKSTVSAAKSTVSARSIFSTSLTYMTAGFSGIAVVSSGIAVVGCGIYCVSRFAYDIGVRGDVEKVAVECLVDQNLASNKSETKADEGEASSSSESGSSDEGETSSSSESARSDEGEASSKSESARSDEGEASSDSESARSDEGEASSGSESGRSDEGEASSSSESATTDEGEASSSSESATTDEGEASSSSESGRSDEREASSSSESGRSDEGEASSSSESAKAK